MSLRQQVQMQMQASVSGAAEVEQALAQQVIQQEREQCEAGLLVQQLQQAQRTVERMEVAAIASAQ
jgi:hypothetical protein